MFIKKKNETPTASEANEPREIKETTSKETKSTPPKKKRPEVREVKPEVLTTIQEPAKTTEGF